MSDNHCEHECDCDCHAPNSRVIHFMACCHQCKVCSKNISEPMWTHLLECHPDVKRD